jgi:hypothetical protein
MTLPTYATPLKRLADEIVAWNAAAGKFPGERAATLEELLNQEARVVEELKELIHAMAESDLTETLDAVCDIFVTASYYLALAKNMQVSIESCVVPPEEIETIQAQLAELAEQAENLPERSVAQMLDNPLIVKSLEVSLALVRDLPVDFIGAQQAVNDNNASKYVASEAVAQESVAHYAAKGEEVVAHASSYLGKPVFVLKRTSDDKIMKPVGFVSVELAPFIYAN